MEINITDANFESEVIKADVPVLVDFWAPWCMPCHAVAPIVEEIAREYEGKIKVCKLNVDQGHATASKYGIMAIPTLVIFKDGKAVDKIVGMVPKSEIEAKIKLYI